MGAKTRANPNRWQRRPSDSSAGRPGLSGAAVGLWDERGKGVESGLTTARSDARMRTCNREPLLWPQRKQSVG
jgi:hypothetical protein